MPRTILEVLHVDGKTKVKAKGTITNNFFSGEYRLGGMTYGYNAPIALAPKRECQGNCREHKGEAVKVKITSTKTSDNLWDGLEFYYCENAIAIDEANGFKCEVLNEPAFK